MRLDTPVTLEFDLTKATDDQLLKIDRALDDLIDDGFTVSQDQIVKQNIIDRGILLNSGLVHREFLKKDITYEALHAAVNEFGREPGEMPKVEDIYHWVFRKRADFNIKVKERGWVESKKGVHTRKKKGEKKLGYYKEIWDVALAISIHIKKYGTQPRPYMRPASDYMRINGLRRIKQSIRG